MSSIADLVTKYSALSPTNVRLWTPGSLVDLGNAILFVVARWSESSLVALRKLTTTLAKEPHPALVVVDIDALPADVRAQLGNLRGVGETFWLRDGKVLSSLFDYDSETYLSTVVENTRIELRRTPSHR